jgi:tetratricopeptide (TPR) repeat protein
MLKDALGAWRGSASEISRLIEAEPGNADAWFSRAGVRGAEGDREGALQDFTMALKLGLRYRESIVAYGNRGLIRYEMADYRGAEEDFSAVIERKPRQKTLMKAALLKRAATREKLGDNDGAAADRRLASLLSPDCKPQTTP